MFDGKIFDEFDESKLHCQNFLCQYFTVGIQEFKCLLAYNYGPQEHEYQVTMSLLRLVWPYCYFAFNIRMGKMESVLVCIAELLRGAYNVKNYSYC